MQNTRSAVNRMSFLLRPIASCPSMSKSSQLYDALRTSYGASPARTRMRSWAPRVASATAILLELTASRASWADPLAASASRFTPSSCCWSLSNPPSRIQRSLISTNEMTPKSPTVAPVRASPLSEPIAAKKPMHTAAIAASTASPYRCKNRPDTVIPFRALAKRPPFLDMRPTFAQAMGSSQATCCIARPGTSLCPRPPTRRRPTFLGGS